VAHVDGRQGRRQHGVPLKENVAGWGVWTRGMPAFTSEDKGQNGDQSVSAHNMAEVLCRAHVRVLQKAGAACEQSQRGPDAGLRGLVLVWLSG
jgi:hypothetical protein